MRRRSLATRLLLANVALVIVAATAFAVTARIVGPELFDTQVQQIGLRYGWTAGGGQGSGAGGRGAGQGTPGTGAGQSAIEDDLNSAFAGSLTVALAVALAIGIVAAILVAVLVSGRLLRPLDRIRLAVRRMAGGHYDEHVPEPSYSELADLAHDVNALGSALDESESRRTRLVSDLAHEMRTPITSLDGLVEGLEDGIFEATAETLTAMRGETRRLQRLADDLGALSRAAEQAFDLELEAADLGEIAASAAMGIQAQFVAAGVELAIDTPVRLPVLADPDRLAQVITNLLRNALRHTPRSGTVTVTAERHGKMAAVTVADTGVGIEPEHLPRVFDRFFRVDGAAPSPGGAGIGLTIARGIALAHHGDVVATSAGPGRGAAFILTVPLSS